MEELSPIATLAATLQDQLATKRDLVADTRRFSLAETSVGYGPEHKPKTVAVVDLADGAEEFGVTRHAHQQIATHLDVPFRTYERLLGDHPDLLANLANGLLSREPAKRLIRTMSGNVRAFLSNGYRPRDNWDLLEHLLPVFAAYPGVEFKECSLTDTRMYVKTFLPGWEIPVTPKVGDVIRGGAIISNSEVGSGSLYIYPYTDRLICTNGAIHTDYGQRRIHVGKRIEAGEEAYELYSDETLRLDDAAYFAKCADTLRACLNKQIFEAIAQQMRDLDEIKIPGSPVDAVQVIAKKHSLSEGEGDSILRYVIEGGSLTGWGYVNGITATARDLENVDRRAELEILAGRMISDPAWTELVPA